MTGGWVLRAGCRGRDLEMWFDGGAEGRRGKARARVICGLCPVARECLAAVLQAEGSSCLTDRFGIFANTSPRQRLALSEGSVHGTKDAPPGCRCGACKDYRAGLTAYKRATAPRRRRRRPTA
ncbi:WhiB family transcriptional regulator [Streptacidiphilus sp. EB103A]|uniref:WhiB family transcriptional regulator n=1 Tax=Streptacidiphilus sp. EB103A TaxID=3156275 RepID=UPI0035138C7C